jgi:FkbM family methyltransferase
VADPSPPRSSGHDVEADDVDFRSTGRGRRMRWFGLKRHVKRVLGWRLPHAVLRVIVGVAPRLAASGRLPAPAYLEEVTGRVRDRSFVMLRPDRCVVAKELYWGNGRRPRPQDQHAVEVFASLAKDADVMLDVGAYTGLFTLVSVTVNPAIQAHAFEIVPDVFHALLDNCVRNDVLHRVTLHHVGVGPAELVRLPSGTRESALPSFYSSRLHFGSGTRIAFRPLDSLIPSIRPAARIVVKVDVEGTENAVLGSGLELLGAFRPDILCEVLAGVAEPETLESLLAPLGYHFYLVRERDLQPRAHVHAHPAYRDWLFTLRSREDLRSASIRVAAD